MGSAPSDVKRRTARWFSCLAFLAIAVVVTQGWSAAISSAADKVSHSFADRVEAVCATNLKEYPPFGPFPLQSFDPEHPQASQLRVIGPYLERNQRGIRPLERALTRLGTPASDAVLWRRVRALVFALLENAQAQRAAALSEDVRGFVKTVKENRSLSAQLQRAAMRAGLDDSGNCSKIF
jgi:hypothetical protein